MTERNSPNDTPGESGTCEVFRDNDGVTQAPDGIDIAALNYDIRQGSKSSREAVERALKELEALDAYAGHRLASVRDEGSFQLAEDFVDEYVRQALRSLATARSALEQDIRTLIEWAADHTKLSTHEIGRVAGLSNSTVSRWQRGAVEK